MICSKLRIGICFALLVLICFKLTPQLKIDKKKLGLLILALIVKDNYQKLLLIEGETLWFPNMEKSRGANS